MIAVSRLAARHKLPAVYANGINVKDETAEKALRVSVPQSLLARAEEVIE